MAIRRTSGSRIAPPAQPQRQEPRRRRGEGLTLRHRWVLPHRILSSPWCRCLDTAKLLNLGEARIEPTFGNPLVWTDRREALATGARAVIRDWKGPGSLLIVTHGALIAMLTGYNPAPGEIVVVDSALKQIGRIPVPSGR